MRFYCLFSIVFISALTLISCNNHDENIPFPAEALNPAQPKVVPLEFSPERKLVWDTIKHEQIRFVEKPFNIDALPVVPFDSTGFRPFTPPAEERFDYNSLPAEAFNIDDLPSKPLNLRTSILPAPKLTHIGKPIPQANKALSIYNMPSVPAMDGKGVTLLQRDKSGPLWIGSPHGLMRYDGENIQTVVPEGANPAAITGLAEDPLGNIWYSQVFNDIGIVNLKNKTISHSSEIIGVGGSRSPFTRDPKGNLWVYNGKDSSLCIIDPVHKTYKSITKNMLVKEQHSHSYAGNAVFNVIKASDDKMWISTFFGGVAIIDLQNRTVKHADKATGLGTDSVQTLIQDTVNNIVWLGGRFSLDAIDLDKNTIKHYTGVQGLKTNPTFSVMLDDHQKVWRLTIGNIEIIDWKNNLLRYVEQKDGLLSSFAITGICDQYGKCWIGTFTGMNMIDQEAQSVNLLQGVGILSLKEDQQKKLWIATSKGLLIVNPERNKAHLLDKAHGLSDDVVQAFFSWNNKMVVVTSGGFQIMDSERKIMSQITAKEGLLNDTVYTFMHDIRGDTWLAGPRNGIDRLDSAHNLTLHSGSRGGLSEAAITDINDAGNGEIWLATGGNGIDVIDITKQTVKTLRNMPGLKDTCNRLLLKDDYGRMWIGTDKGIYVADTKSHLLTAIGKKEGLTDPRVTSLLLYKGSVIASAGFKAYLVKAPKPGDTSSKWNVSVLQYSPGLKRPSINIAWLTDAISADGKFLWGDNGISVLNKIAPIADSGKTMITGFTVMTSTPSFTSKSELQKGDTVWTADTFYTNKPQMLANSNSGVAANYEWDDVEGPFNLPTGLKLPHKENYLQFYFADVNLHRQDSTWYSYILEGIDKAWSNPSLNSSTENYLNLPPGHYTFKVSHKKMDGEWSQPAVFSFSILPPWYQTWWAYTLYVLLALAILRTYIAYRSRILKKENRVLEEKVALRTAQLEKSIADLKATQSQLIQSEKMASLGELTAGIAHEIQNPLNFVTNFSEISNELIDEMKAGLNEGDINEAMLIADDIKQNLEKINHHGKRADAIVKGMLQHSRSSSGIKEPTNINALCDEYLRLSYHGLRAKDKTFNANFTTDFDQSVDKINIIPQDIGRVLLNLYNNAFYAVAEKKKQQPENYAPAVSVSTKRSGDKVMITVTDNGNGIPQNIVDKIFQPFFTTKPTGQGTGLGLSLSYDIVKAHGGDLGVETKAGEASAGDSEKASGSIFTIVLPY